MRLISIRFAVQIVAGRIDEVVRNRELEAIVRQRGEKLVLLDVPLLFESGGDAVCDHVLVVSAPGEVQRARVLERQGMTEERFQEILAQQMPDAEKRSRADFVISTDRPIEDTRDEIRALVDELRKK